MRVLIACEFSGIVRDAFRARGFDAWSCDLLPSERPGPHIQANVGHVIRGAIGPDDWSLMIAHPPCTYLSNSGVRWLYGGKGRERDNIRWASMRYAGEFFMDLQRAFIRHICIENPIPHRHAKLPEYSQIIQPWQFGHPETKATCLWLKNLPPLRPTNIVEGRKGRVHHESPGPERWKNRSRTYQGIADAMAEQWGKLLTASSSTLLDCGVEVKEEC